MGVPEDSTREVREANARFYRALNALDLAAMESVWSHQGFVRCIHPGWELIVGWDAVRASWEGIFESTDAHRVEPGDVVVHVSGEIAWVSCIERITVGEAGGTSFAVATNLFQRFEADGAGWRMILHHASLLPISLSETFDAPEVVH